MQFITLLITLPLALFAILVVLANPEPVTLFLWPEDELLSLSLPLWQMTVGLLFGGFFLGALFVWLLSQKTRFRYWQEARKSARLEKELEDIHAKAEAEKDARKQAETEARTTQKTANTAPESLLLASGTGGS